MEIKETRLEKIKRLQKEKDVVILAHYYVDGEVQKIADYVGDSFYLSKAATQVEQKNIFFVPDNNLGRYVAEKVPEKHFIFHDGFCHVHKSIHAKNVEEAKAVHPDALVLTHPECTQDVIALSDFVGSTSEIIDYATNSTAEKFIICTEMGVFFELQQKNPNKKFYSVGHRQFCPNMKRVTLEKVERALEEMEPVMELSEEIIESASRPLVKMLELAK